MQYCMYKTVPVEFFETPLVLVVVTVVVIAFATVAAASSSSPASKIQKNAISE